MQRAKKSPLPFQEPESEALLTFCTPRTSLVSFSVPAPGRSQTGPAAPVLRAGPGQAQGNGKAAVCSGLLSLIHVSSYPRAQIRFLGFFGSRGPCSRVLAPPRNRPHVSWPQQQILARNTAPGEGECVASWTDIPKDRPHSRAFLWLKPKRPV